MENKVIPINPGGAISRPDPRDYKWEELGSGISPFNWSLGFDIEEKLAGILGKTSFKLPVKDQDGSSSCGGQAWGYYGAVKEAVATKSFEERSAKFIYSQTFYPNGGGSTGRDNCILVTKSGWGLESLTKSYDNDKPPGEAFMVRPQDITDQARIEAKKALAFSYANVAIDIDSIAQAVKENDGVVILIEGSNNGTWLKPFPNPPTPGQTIWRHWLYVGKAKMIDGKKYIGFINSWGQQVGINGWQWVGESYMGNIKEGWTLVFKVPEPVQSFYHKFIVDIKFGTESDEVTALQRALQIDGTFPKGIKPTRYFGDITRRAVLDFQIKYQIAPLSELYGLNGKSVGPKTRAKLNVLFGN